MAGEVSFRPSAGDCVAASRDWFWLSLLNARSLAWLAAASLSSAAIGAAGSQLDDRPASLALALGFALLGLIISLLVIVFLFLLVPVRARRLYRQDKGLQQLWRYSWSEAGLSASSDKAAASYAWGDLHRSVVGRRNLLFFLNDQLFLFLPRHLLTPQQEADLMMLSGVDGRS